MIHSQVTEPEKVARILAEELEMDESKIAEKIQKVTSMEKIRTNVEKETGDRIRDYDLDGVKVDEDFKRYYPYDTFTSSPMIPWLSPPVNPRTLDANVSDKRSQ